MDAQLMSAHIKYEREYKFHPVQDIARNYIAVGMV